MKVPPLLKQGDRIKVIAPSGRVSEKRCEEGIGVLTQWGLMVERGENLYRGSGFFSGDDSERLADLQDALDDPGIRAIFCARGGYGLSRIIDRIDLTRFIESPKWIVGFSDITLLHLWINMNCGVATLHGEMVANYPDRRKTDETLGTLYNTLFSEQVNYRWNTANMSEGSARGIITGGNLSLLCNLAGTGVSRWLESRILFIEETGEYLYRLDRMLSNLRLSGILGRISGLVIGGITAMEDTGTPFGKSIEEIVLEAVALYGFPVAMGFPAGHQYDNRAITFGREVTFTASKGIAELIYT